jgi:hypothetical protein
MTTVTLWYLIAMGGYSTNTMVYSPPMKDLATCETIRKHISAIDSNRYIQFKCIQIPTEVKK